jgi:hypothetical protein
MRVCQKLACLFPHLVGRSWFTIACGLGRESDEKGTGNSTFLAVDSGRGVKTVLVTITDVQGSGARPPGSQFAVSSAGNSVESLSSGFVEAAVVSDALQSIKFGETKTIRFVHANKPHQDVLFLQGTDPISSPTKAKGIGELGLCSVAAAIANTFYNSFGIRIRNHPGTLNKLLPQMPLLF